MAAPSTCSRNATRLRSWFNPATACQPAAQAAIPTRAAFHTLPPRRHLAKLRRSALPLSASAPKELGGHFRDPQGAQLLVLGLGELQPPDRLLELPRHNRVGQLGEKDEQRVENGSHESILP